MWELEYKGARKSLAGWGITRAERKTVSLDADTFYFETPVDASAPSVFEYGQQIKVFRDGEQWFAGVIEQIPSTLSAAREVDGFLALGPWWQLQNRVFQKSWSEYKNPLAIEQGTVNKFRSHVILNLNLDGTYQNTTQQITEALQWCLDSAQSKGEPAPFQIGVIDLPLAQPYTFEVVDRVCSEIILMQARWTPDCVGWFDYTTNPPTFHLRKRSALAVVNLQVPGDDIQEIEIRPRYDLKLPSVVIKYEQVNVENGVAFPHLTIDTAGPEGSDGREHRAMVSTVNLEGATVNYSIAPIVCEPILHFSPEWWQSIYEPLARGVRNLKISGVVRTTVLPRMLVAGNVTEWMLGTNKKSAVREVIKAVASYEVIDAEGVLLETRKDQPISVEVTATDLESGNYYSSFDRIIAEPAPVGLAAYLYNAVSVLHFDGSVVLSEDECSGKVSVGQLLNLEGLRSELATMNAQVQSVTERVEDGSTTIVIGPPKHLGKDDIIAFLQANRNRQRYTSSSSMTGGVSPAATPLALGKETPMKNSNASGGAVEVFSVSSPGKQGFAQIAHGDLSDKNWRCRIIEVCDDSSGVPKKRRMGVFCTEIFD